MSVFGVVIEPRSCSKDRWGLMDSVQEMIEFRGKECMDGTIDTR